jgi:hypothetical protein
MEGKIKSVEKGFGEDSIFFSTSNLVSETYRVDEIKQEGKQVSNDSMISVYRGYKNGKIFFEMGASIDITLTFFE